MNRLLLIVASVFISVNAYSQKDCNIRNEYNEIFSIEKMQHGDRAYLFKSVNEIDGTSCFSDLVNNYASYIDYLRTNFTDHSNYEELIALSDSAKLQNAYVEFLQNDRPFNALMYELTEKITDQTNHVPDTVTVDELLNVAVKFFSILRINEEGYYAGKVCAGINGLKQTEKVRQPHVEAFCFSSIAENLQGDRYNMYDEFVSGIKELYTINLGVDDADRLLRAQGAMYMYMRNSDRLKAMLLSEYEDKKKYLPFVLEVED